MGTKSNPLHKVGPWLDNRRILREEGRLNRWFVDAQFEKPGGPAPTPKMLAQDTVEFLVNTGEKAPKGWFQKNLWGRLPQPVQSGLGKFLVTFNKLPLINRLSTGVKSDLLFSLVLGGIGLIGSTMSGFAKTEGSIIDKVWGGLQSGFKSGLTTAAELTAGASVALLLPRLFGVTNILGPAGVIIGTLGSMTAGFIVGPIMQKLLGHNPPEAPKTTTTEFSSEQLIPPSELESNAVLQAIEQQYQLARQTGNNPWMDPGMLHQVPTYTDQIW